MIDVLFDPRTAEQRLADAEIAVMTAGLSAARRDAARALLRAPPRPDGRRRKLSEDDVREMRRLLAGGMTQRVAAERFSVSLHLVKSISTGRRRAGV